MLAARAPTQNAEGAQAQIGVESEHDKNASDWNRRDRARDDGQKVVGKTLAETVWVPHHEDERPILCRSRKRKR